MIQVLPVPAFTDNYIWLITNEERKYAAIVDPGDADPVLASLQERNLEPCAILTTHHHADHIGGIDGILQQFPDLPVYGPVEEDIPQRTIDLQEGMQVNLEQLGLHFEVLDVRGHTSAHIAYYGEGSLFCGDTLFGSGCGRVFEGTMEQMFAALQKMAQLPAETAIYCAHEYTVDNLGFAKWVEPESADIDARMEASWDLLDDGRATVPFMLEEEFKTNPFLRTHIPEVLAKAEEVAGRSLNAPVEVFAALRIWKDTEY